MCLNVLLKFILTKLMTNASTACKTFKTSSLSCKNDNYGYIYYYCHSCKVSLYLYYYYCSLRKLHNHDVTYIIEKENIMTMNIYFNAQHGTYHISSAANNITLNLQID